jgi:hypothetical protein
LFPDFYRVEKPSQRKGYTTSDIASIAANVS